MSNALDGDVTLEPGAVALWQDRTTTPVTDLLEVGYTAIDPNGVRSGPIGSLLSGPTGTWQNTNGASAWTPLGTASGGVRQFGSTAGQVVTSAIAGPQLLATLPVSAGLLNAVGRTLRPNAVTRIVTTDGVTTVQPLLKFGALLIPLGFHLPSGVGAITSEQLWIRTAIAGAAGAFDAWGVGSTNPYGTPMTASLFDIDAFFGGPFSPFDFTVAHDFELFIEFSAVNPLNSVRCDGFLLDLGTA